MRSTLFYGTLPCTLGIFQALDFDRVANISKVLPPSQDSFYHVPKDITNFEPGEVIRHRNTPSPIGAFGISAEKYVQNSYQLLYRTINSKKTPTATVITVLVPINPDFGKIVSLETAEDAASIDCAPSFGFQSASSSYPRLSSPTTELQVLVAQDLLHRGWIVVVPDFQGPKGEYPAGEMGAYASLDGIRATLSSGGLTGVKEDAKIALWGYSGGASVSLSTVQAMPSYARELNIVAASFGGTIGSAVGLSSNQKISFLNGSDDVFIIVIAILGKAAVDDEFEKKVVKNLKPNFRHAFLQAKHECLDFIKDRFRKQDILSMFKDAGFVTSIDYPEPIFKDVAPTVPMYWYQSDLDTLTPTRLAEATAKKLCDEGAHIHFVVDAVPNVTHASFSVYGTERSLDWLDKAFNGGNFSTGCSQERIRTREVPSAFTDLFPPNIQAAVRAFAESNDG